jgi:hypothetical protein
LNPVATAPGTVPITFSNLSRGFSRKSRYCRLFRSHAVGD